MIVFQRRFPNNKAQATDAGFRPQLDDKALLLKKMDELVSGHRGLRHGLN